MHTRSTSVQSFFLLQHSQLQDKNRKLTTEMDAPSKDEA